jgi:nitroimidazol reductase NimA-like FMN-containing flavoprotein (pyridoxamine 5'-phosphate oxidase superfamily)
VRLIDDRTGIEVLDRGACLRLLRANNVGRIGVLDGGRPVVLPVNYAMDAETVVFRTASGTKLAAAVRGAPVCFEIDHSDPVYQTGWSVVVHGWAEEVLREEAIGRLDELPLRSWAPRDLDHWVVVTPESIGGRRVVALTAEGSGG